jgi:hypothetical protein
VAGGVSLIKNEPRTVLALQKWAILEIQGSNLDIIDLYCKIKERLYQFSYQSDHDGACTVSLMEDDLVERVSLVTALGEIVPGTGEINVI